MTRRNRKAKPMPQQSRADALVPAVQRVAIVTQGGRVIREAIAQQAEWDDPDDRNTRSKSPRQVIGYRRADPLLYLHARGDDVTIDHIKAAHRFRDDWEISEGARPGFERSEAGSSDPMGPQEIQFRARDNYRAAIQAVGIKLSEILVMVVLQCQAPTAYAEENGVSLPKVVGYLTAALDRLQEHYEQGPAPSLAKKDHRTTR